MSKVVYQEIINEVSSLGNKIPSAYTNITSKLMKLVYGIRNSCLLKGVPRIWVFGTVLFNRLLNDQFFFIKKQTFVAVLITQLHTLSIKILINASVDYIMTVSYQLVGSRIFIWSGMETSVIFSFLDINSSKFKYLQRFLKNIHWILCSPIFIILIIYLRDVSQVSCQLTLVYPAFIF